MQQQDEGKPHTTGTPHTTGEGKPLVDVWCGYCDAITTGEVVLYGGEVFSEVVLLHHRCI